jgi:hypothetical protein
MRLVRATVTIGDCRSALSFTSPIAATGAGTDPAFPLPRKRQKTAHTPKAAAPHNSQPTTHNQNPPRPHPPRHPPAMLTSAPTMQRYNASTLPGARAASRAPFPASRRKAHASRTCRAEALRRRVTHLPPLAPRPTPHAPPFSISAFPHKTLANASACAYNAQ